MSNRAQPGWLARRARRGRRPADGAAGLLRAVLLPTVLLLTALAAGCGGETLPTAVHSASASPTVAAATGSPRATPLPSVATATPPPIARPPASSASTGPPGAWFEDAFDTARGWVSADTALLEGAVEGGAFTLRPHPAPEPAYVWAPKDGAAGPDLTVEAVVTFPASGRAVAGVALADPDFGLRLVLLLGSSGEWRLHRDDAAALHTLASGRIAAADPGTPLQIRLILRDGAVSAWAGDVELGRAAATIDVGHAGLAAQAPADGERILVDDFRVTLGP